MASTVSGVPFSINMDKSTTSTKNNFNLTNDDFMRILMAEMSTPNLNNLFSSEQPSGSGSSFGNGMFSSLMAMNMSSMFNNSSSDVLKTSLSELPLLSLLIGKTISAVDQDNVEISGTVQRVLMQNGTAMLDVGDSIIPSSSITEVK